MFCITVLLLFRAYIYPTSTVLVDPSRGRGRERLVTIFARHVEETLSLSLSRLERGINEYPPCVEFFP